MESSFFLQPIEFLLKISISPFQTVFSAVPIDKLAWRGAILNLGQKLHCCGQEKLHCCGLYKSGMGSTEGTVAVEKAENEQPGKSWVVLEERSQGSIGLPLQL